MSLAFYSNKAENFYRQANTVRTNNDIDIDQHYELQRCIEWINKNKFSKVALQFPEALLQDAGAVALKLEKETQKRFFFILADSSYASCCVDEIAAEHILADAIIHFGHACLSPTKRLPVLYIFGKKSLDVQNVTSEFRRLFPDVTTDVAIYYEVFYSHAIGEIAENLKDYQNLIITGLKIPHTENNIKVNDNEIKITKCQRHFIISKAKDLDDYCMFYIGSQELTLTNAMLSFNKCKFYTYDSIKKVAQPETLDINRYLKKRYYFIEKAKDARIIGILVGTLGTSNYLTIVKHLRELIHAAGRKSYTLVVGRVNVAKLGNFPDIEIFVSVACMESSIIECKNFYQPIITPYELEIALNENQVWTGDYVTDFSELLPGAAKHVPPSEARILEGDVSLITGNLRTLGLLNPSSEEVNDGSSAVVQRDSLTMSTIHSQAAGEYLSQRSWAGLEQSLGETPVTSIQEGRKGIASHYDDEGKEDS